MNERRHEPTAPMTKPTTAWVSEQPGRHAHAAFRAIVAELSFIDYTLRLGDERFEFWVQRCAQKYPRQAHPDLYAQLGALAVQLAHTESTLALQLFALGACGLRDDDAAALARGQAWLSGAEAERTRRLARQIAALSRRDRRQSHDRRAGLGRSAAERRTGIDRRAAA